MLWWMITAKSKILAWNLYFYVAINHFTFVKDKHITFLRIKEAERWKNHKIWKPKNQLFRD